MSNQVDAGRRSMLVTSIGLTALVSTGCATQAGPTKSQSLGADLKLPAGLVEVQIEILWTNMGGAPVVGAKVFEHEVNKLLGETGKDGKLTITVENGTVLRLVEPSYGQQQALRLVQGALVPNKSVRVAAVAEGWTWT